MTNTEGPPPSRFVVGIDLGTTNCAVGYVDTQRDPWRCETFAVPQVVDAGQVGPREGLPSFHYQPAAGELPSGALRRPWDAAEPGYCVGTFAREHGRLVPGRLIDSAKSWLCHSGVDRSAKLLPWQGTPDVETLSPVEVSARYLRHLREAWDARHPGFPLADQDVVVTLPASFDEIARGLTVAAARLAGLPRIVLIEEPQAAFYSWIDSHRDDWEQRVAPGQKILVCDIGGGTTDFTLIRVRERDGLVEFQRVAVGEHLLLGGDNLDLALARHVEQRLAGENSLDPRQWMVLVRTCRHVKETLLGPDPPDAQTVHLPGTGTKLIGGGLHVEVTRDEVEQLLLEGFLPAIGLDARPAPRQSGFRELGLPYAADPGMTRYLAAFLTAHRHVAEADPPTSGHDPARPDVVLLNGGFFNSPVLRERLLASLAGWFSNDGEWRPDVLANERLDLAVARGAAYYGMVRRGQGVRIAAGLARTYYIGVEAAGPEAEPAAVCLTPAGLEPGDEIDLTKYAFSLSVQEPVEFPLLVSSTRLTDRPGDLVTSTREELTPLPPIRTVLRTRGRKAEQVRVHLQARLTEIGTLELWCREVDGTRRWALEFDVRSTTETDREAHQGAAESRGVVDEELISLCRAQIDAVFAADGRERPGGLPKRIGEAIATGRDDWPPSLLRHIWHALMDVEPGRRKSEDHEGRWLNLLGFALRPGYGLALDDWRVAETWRALNRQLVHATPQCRAEWWILWRRIAGGLSRGQQESLATPVLSLIRQSRRSSAGRSRKKSGFAASTHEEAEIWRMIGAFEWLDLKTRIDMGGVLLDRLAADGDPGIRAAQSWALGRLGARVPTYGPLNTVVPGDVAAAWLDRLLTLPPVDPLTLLAVMQLARKSGDRFRDIPPETRTRTIDWLEQHAAPAHFVELVSEGGRLEQDEAGLVYGESLPLGLQLPM